MGVPVLTTEYLSYAELDKRAQAYAEAIEAEASTISNFLVFHAGTNRFAIPMPALDEISEMSHGVGLETASSNIMGLTSIRSDMVLLLDLKSLLGLGATSQNATSQRILVLTDNNSHKWAFLVERLEGVFSLDTSQFQSDDDTSQATFGSMVKAVGEHDDKAVGVLEVGELLDAAKRCV